MCGSKNDSTFTQWNTTQSRKEPPTLCDSMDGTRKYYAKWNKPGGESKNVTHS